MHAWSMLPQIWLSFPELMQPACRGPRQIDEALAGLMELPDGHAAAPSPAAHLQRPALRIIIDMVAGFCTGARYACCILLVLTPGDVQRHV